MSAAPAACRTRKPTSAPRSDVSAHAAEAAVNTRSPARNPRLLPIRSLTRPAGTNSAANVIAYALRIHERSDRSSTPSETAMSPRATLTMNRSKPESSTPTATTAITAGGALVRAVSCVMQCTVGSVHYMTQPTSLMPCAAAASPT